MSNFFSRFALLVSFCGMAISSAFSQAVSFTVFQSTRLFTVHADFNSDGREDFILGPFSGSGCSQSAFGVVLSTSDGVYAAPVCYKLPSGQPAGFVIGDFNGDGNPDLIVSTLTNFGAGDFYEYLGKASGALHLKTGFTAGAIQGTAADVNHDGKIDLLFVGNGGLNVWFGNGDGSFTIGPKTTMSAGGDQLFSGDGEYPLGAIAQGRGGAMLGGTQDLDEKNSYYTATGFKIRPDGGFQVLHEFYPDGPVWGPTLATDGKHYGTLAINDESVFKMFSVSINVTASQAGGPSIPSNAVEVRLIEELPDWTAVHDEATKGTSTGTTSLVSSPAMSGSARRFQTSYTQHGGERYNVHLPADQTSTHFLYDAQIYISNGSSHDIANLEMDLNQVMPSGERVVFGFQCNVWAHTWDYAGSTGYPDSTGKLHHWIHSNQRCDVQKWATNTWHHVQIQYSRDDSGNVTYKAVWLDGVEQYINVTVPNVHPKGWKTKMSTNFQVGGSSSRSGSSTIYLDELTLYKW
jgi:hypothetical protein